MQLSVEAETSTNMQNSTNVVDSKEKVSATDYVEILLML